MTKHDLELLSEQAFDAYTRQMLSAPAPGEQASLFDDWAMRVRHHRETWLAVEVERVRVSA